LKVDHIVIIRHARRTLFFVLLALLVSSCKRDEIYFDDLRLNTNVVNVDVEMIVKKPDGVPRRATRAVDTGPYLLTGTDAENTVNTLTLFLVNLDDSGNEIRTTSEYHTVYLGSNEMTDNGDGTYTITLELSTTLGKKHLYVGANLRSAQIAAFVSGSAYQSSSTTQAGVMSEVMDFDASGNGSNIAMFGAYNAIGASAEASEVEITSTTTTLDLTTTQSVALERLVGKVLLTFTKRTDFTGVGDTDCRTDEITFNDVFEGLTGYGTANYHGWCQLSDIRYVLNATNKQVYLERRPSAVVHGDTDIGALDNITMYWNQDPNQAISSYVGYNSSTMELDTISGYSDHFIHSTKSEITYDETNGGPFASTYLTAQPLAYDEALLNTSGSNTAITTASAHQQAGLYCLENTVLNDYGDGSSFGGYSVDDVAGYVSTHLAIAIRYIPKTFYVVESAALVETTFATRSAAETALAAWTDNDASVTYPANTYWINMQTNKYYTSEARKLAVAGGADATQFTQFSGGYSYFRTFIDPLQKTTAGVLTYENNAKTIWGLDRNSYHLLNVPAITLPSTPNLTDYIRVNSLTDLTWTSSGSTSIKVTPQ